MNNIRLFKNLCIMTAVCCGLVCGAANAEERWISHGPYGGTVTHMLASGGSDGGVFAALPGQGVYFLAEGSSTWEQRGGGFVDSEIYGFVQHPQNPDVLYLCARINYERGIFQSTDGGYNWTLKVDGFDGNYIHTLAIDPTNPQVMYASAWEKMYKSEDGGDHWTHVGTFQPPGSECHAILVDPADTDVIYAAVRNYYSVNPGDPGIYKSIDGGMTWNPSGAGLVSKQVQTLTFDPFDSQTIYAGVYGNDYIPGGGVYVSRNAGASWSAISGLLPQTIEVYSIAVKREPGAGNTTLMAACGYHVDLPVPPVTWNARFYSSTDNGETWQLASQGIAYPEIMSLVYDPARPQRVFVGTRAGGVFRSTDGGATFVHFSKGLAPLRVNALAVHPYDQNVVYAGVSALQGEYDDHDAGVFVSFDGGVCWEPRSADMCMTGSFESSALAIAPADPDIIHVAHSGWGFYRSNNEGMSWQWRGQEHGIKSYFTPDVVVNPDAPMEVFACGVGSPRVPPNIFKSIDGGVSWYAVASWLSDHGFASLAIDPSDSDVMYAGTRWEGVFKSADGGETWTSTGGDVFDSVIYSIVVNPAEPEHIYIGDAYWEPGASNGVCVSRDAGVTWERINDGLVDQRVLALAIDATVPAFGLKLYASTPTGLYRRIDDGVWEQMSEGFDDPRVYSIELGPQQTTCPRAFYVGTERGAYRRVLIGDLDYDYDVDLSDFAKLQSNYSVESEAVYDDGDLDGDGDVDLTDFETFVDAITGPGQ